MQSGRLAADTTNWVFRPPFDDEETGLSKVTTGASLVVQYVFWQAPAATQPRPGAARRAAMLATDEGKARLTAARQALGDAFVADGVVGLAALRLRTGRSQEQLAREIGITQPALSKIESAVGAIRSDTVAKLARALGVSEGDVLAAHIETKKDREAASLRAQRP